MPNEITAFAPNWVNDKLEMVFSKNFQRIIEFYVFSTPCSLVSSSVTGMNNRRRTWGDKPWNNTKLKHYLLRAAKLKEDVNYIKATGDKKRKSDNTIVTPSDMQEKIRSCGLNDRFHTKRDKNRIVFISSGKSAEFLDIFFYIRCALAHGRFRIYEADDPIYVLEAAEKHKIDKETKALVKARMVLKESTLLEWARIIDTGATILESLKRDEEKDVRDKIIELISSHPCVSKDNICDRLNADYSTVLYKKYIKALIDALKKEGIIEYSAKDHFWILCH